MDPKAATLALIASLNLLNLRGTLRRALELAEGPAPQRKGAGVCTSIRAALDGISSESQAVHLDGEIAQDCLDLQEWLDNGGFSPGWPMRTDLELAYHESHPHLPVFIRARVIAILAAIPEA